MELLYIFCVILVLITVISTILLISEKRKQQNNPIPKLLNHDNRFNKIKSVYGQKMFTANRGK